MRHKAWNRTVSAVLALAMALALLALPTAAAADPKPFANTSGDGGEDYINLCVPRTFEAMVPVDMTEEEAEKAAESVTWSLDYDESSLYVDPKLFPNHTKGGALDTWKALDGSPLFTQPVTGVKTVDGKVYLSATFESKLYFYTATREKDENGNTIYRPDPSAPHSNGGAYLDVCGWFDLTATADGKGLGSVKVKVTPYDNFHTMKEFYADIDALVDYARGNTDLYVERFSMGKSQGDNGLESLDMPYLIVAKSKNAVDRWQALKAQAEKDPAAVLKQLESGSLTNYQVPVMYSNVHANEVAASDAVMRFAWMLVETAASESGSIDYRNLTGFTAEGEAELAKQMGPAGEKGSVAIPDLVKDTATYLGYIKPEGSSVSGPVDLEKYYNMETVTVNVDELLDDVFFILVPEENVEGRTYVTRTASGGFDLNRDNSFQTQAETQNMTRLIASWNPVSFAEFHGRVQQFQCEPCDPPHEPNFEYDLLAEHLVSGGEALGIASVANNAGYNSYVMPQRDYLSYTGSKTADGADETRWYDPWDDMSTSYTPQYAMLHGTVAYTVEFPAYNDFTAEGVAYGQLGQSRYIADNKDDYLACQLKIFERGVTNANSNAYDLVGQWFCDQYDVEGAEAGLFRPVYDGAGQNGNFYPECYLIPLDGVNQTNLKAAKEMVEYLERNGVTVGVTGKAVTYGGVEYPAGTAVVSMYQAKRSVANGALYNGTLITDWPVLYSEGITAFNKTRGFDMATVAEPEAYKTIAAAVYATAKADVASHLEGTKADAVVLHNTSEDAAAAVNALLRAGKQVSMITDGRYDGSFLIAAADWEAISRDYLVRGVYVDTKSAGLTAEKLDHAPVVYIAGKPEDNKTGFVKTTLTSGSYEYNYDRQSMEILGFTTTGDPAKADLIIGAASLDDAALNAVKSGTSYIGYGRRAVSSAAKLFGDGELVRNTVSGSSMDALAYVKYDADSLITASYVTEGDDILYGYGAGYFAAIPKDAEVLIRLDGDKQPLEGFLCADGEHYHDFLNDSIQAISYQENGMDVTLFANTLTNKVHQRDEFGFIANAAFASVAGDAGDHPSTSTSFTDVPGAAWYAGAVEQVSDAGLMTGTTKTTFSPGWTATRATMATVLWRMAGQPVVNYALNFTDVKEGQWYTEAIRWAASEGIATGDNVTFGIDDPITREQFATMLYRYEQKVNKGGFTGSWMFPLDYPDAAKVSQWADEAMHYMTMHKVVTGKPGNLLDPQGGANRAQVAAVLDRWLTGKKGPDPAADPRLADAISATAAYLL